MTNNEDLHRANSANPANQLAPLAGLAEGQPAERDRKGRFLTGNNGGGRPKGSRNRLTDTFLAIIGNDFAEHGQEAVARLRESDPATYLRMIGALIPSTLVLAHETKLDYSSMSFEEIDDEIKREEFNENIRRCIRAVT